MLFALNARYLINEKAALGEAQGLPLTLADLPGRVDAVWGAMAGAISSQRLRTLQRLDADMRAPLRRRLASAANEVLREARTAANPPCRTSGGSLSGNRSKLFYTPRRQRGNSTLSRRLHALGAPR